MMPLKESTDEEKVKQSPDRLSQLKSLAARTPGRCSPPPLKQYADSRSPVTALTTSSWGPQASQASPPRPSHTDKETKGFRVMNHTNHESTRDLQPLVLTAAKLKLGLVILQVKA